MKITEKKEVVHTTIEEVTVGRQCDVCKREINKNADGPWSGWYNYFVIHTWHNDWGYDSVDSHEYYDACCDECAVKFVSKYLHEAQKVQKNTMNIKITHANTLQEGAV